MNTRNRRPLPRLAALVLAGAAALGAQAATDPRASRLYEDALTRYEKRDYGGAIVQLKNALQIDKNILTVQVLLGKALLANGDVIAAEVALEEALRLGVNRAEVVVPLGRALVQQGKHQQLLDNPRFAPAGLPAGLQPQIILMRAGAAGDLGDPRTAMRYVEEARALAPNDAASWLAEVPIRIRARQLKEAAAAADKALALAPQVAEAHYVRGQVHHVGGNLQAALVAYDKAIALQPTHTEALISRAGLNLDLGRFADTARDAAELARSSAKEPRGAYLRAMLAEREGKGPEARTALREVTALLDPAPIEFLRYRPQLLILGGLSHYGLGQREKAKPYLEAAQRAQPGSPVAKLLAQIYLAEKNTDRAIEALDSYLRGFPNDSQATLLLASAHMSQGRHTRATQLMQDALKLTDAPELRTMLGLSLVGSGKFSDAVGELETAFRKDPSQLQAGTALATIYLMAQQGPKALRVADALAKQHPRNPGVLTLLGSARARTGDEKGSRAAFEEALKIEPNLPVAHINLARLDAATRQFDAAAARLNGVLARDDKNVDALLELGLLFERRGQLAEAQRWIEKSEDHSGSNLQPGVALVDFHLRHRRPDAAREAVKRLTAKAPEAIPVLLAVARTSIAGGDVTAARTSLTRAATLANYDAPLLLQIGLMQSQIGHLAGAAHSLEKALAERPDYLPAQALLSEVELRQGELGKAEQRARQIVASQPKAGIGYALLGDVAMAKRQTPASVENYRRAHQLEQSSTSLLRLHGALVASDATAANQLAEQWLKSRPKDMAVRRALADGYARAGRLDAAKGAYRALLALAPDDAEALNNLANVLLLDKDPGALAVAEQALAKRPEAPHILGTAGWAAFKAGQTDRALQLLRDARLRDPDNPGTRYFLGAVLASTGRTQEARDELQAAVQSARGFDNAKEAEQLLKTLK